MHTLTMRIPDMKMDAQIQYNLYSDNQLPTKHLEASWNLKKLFIA